jgi:hypothetical protein
VGSKAKVQALLKIIAREHSSFKSLRLGQPDFAKIFLLASRKKICSCVRAVGRTLANCGQLRSFVVGEK